MPGMRCKITPDGLELEVDEQEPVWERIRGARITELQEPEIKPIGLCRCEYCDTVNNKNYGMCDYCGAPLPAFAKPVIQHELEWFN